MKRLYLTVEGQTEEQFALKVVQPHLVNFNVFLHPPRFMGPHGRRRGRIPRGGLLGTFAHAMADIKRWLKEDKSTEARFSMMADLYHLPHDFPGYYEGMSKPTGAEQAAILEQSLAAALGDERFVPYVQVHEFEALILSDPGQIATLYEVKDAEMKMLCEECRRYKSPEEINHGQHSHPKQRIARRVPEYDANIAGPLLAESIGLGALRRRCPHFGEWLTKLEGLGAGEP